MYDSKKSLRTEELILSWSASEYVLSYVQHHNVFEPPFLFIRPKLEDDFKDLRNNTIKYSFFSAFAISVTLLIARIRNVISSSNMIMGVDLTLALWTGGMYGVAMVIRSLNWKGFKKLLRSTKVYIGEIIICSILVVAAWV
jgi:hypothetical protein